jgi:hypothetical protein
MDENYTNRAIGYALFLIIAYYILQMILPLLWWAVVIMVVWRICLERNKFK